MTKNEWQKRQKSYHYKRSIVCSLRKTKESIKRKGRLTKENRDNLQDMIDPYLTYQFKILKIKKKR